MKVAIVHEWFIDYSGSERVVEQLVNTFPDADVFSVVEFLNETQKQTILKNKPVKTTFIQKLPFAKKHYKNYLPLMPIAIEQLNLSSYDVIISSSHAVAKGVITHVNQLHISYIHSPIRYAWDLYHQYLTESNLTSGFRGFLAKLILHYIRIWDFTTASRVDYFISNSNYIGKRIKKVYNQDATTIYPPVDVESFEVQTEKKDFYITASRLVPYKKVDLIVETFKQLPNKKLIIIGAGPDFKKVSKSLTQNIQMLGYQDFNTLKKYMMEARAFIFAADEDFGITPVEAQACGTPVIAYKKGGSLETVDPESGVFFKTQDISSLTCAIKEFEAKENLINKVNIRKHAERFSAERFRKEIKDFVETAYINFQEES